VQACRKDIAQKRARTRRRSERLHEGVAIGAEGERSRAQGLEIAVEFNISIPSLSRIPKER
jgi:hypothetical protein